MTEDPSWLDDIRNAGPRWVDLSPQFHTLPQPGERCVITAPPSRIVAGLLFDRVWVPHVDAAPNEIRFWAGTPYEYLLTLRDALSWQEAGSEAAGTILESLLILNADEPTLKEFYEDPEKPRTVREMLVLMAGQMRTRRGVSATVGFDEAADLKRAYRPGSYRAVLTSLTNVPVVTGAGITWDQVKEFRSDAEARSSYRRFIHWLDTDMVGKSAQFIADEICVKSDRYREAISKHGLETATGCLKRMFEPEWIAAASVSASAWSAAGHDLWAAVSALVIAGGRAAVNVAEALIERDRVVHGADSEIAFVHEITEKAKDKPPDGPPASDR